MTQKFILIPILLAILHIGETNAQALPQESVPGVIGSVPTVVEDCYLYPVRPLGMTDKFNGIPDSSITASSSYSVDTAGQYARLHYSDAFYWDPTLTGAGAWTANDQDTKQYIQIDLGQRRVVTSIGTQGRQGSLEFVEDYYVYYSDSDTPVQWTIVRDEYGNPLLFDGNTDDNTVKLVNLKYPVIARFIRINPQRWRNLISMRLELFGCDYRPFAGNFDGTSRIDMRLDLPNRATQTAKDVIKFRFRTSQIDGLILYGDDGQNDYLSVEIYRGRLRVNINLGTPFGRTDDTDNILDASSLLDDNQWHDVKIVRNLKDLNISVDRIEMWRNISSTFMHLNLNRNVSLGGLPNYSGRRGVSVTRNFVGCLEEVWFNGVNMIRDALRSTNPNRNLDVDWQTAIYYPTLNPEIWWGRQLTERELNITGFSVSGVLGTTCTATANDPSVLSFPSLGDQEYQMIYIKVERDPSGNLKFNVDFRTFNRGGTLFYHTLDVAHTQIVYLGLDSVVGLLQLTISLPGVNTIDYTVPNKDINAQDRAFSDGLWHRVELSVRQNEVELIVDGIRYLTQQVFTKMLNFDSVSYVGGGRPGLAFRSFQGCMRLLRINSMEVAFDKLPAGSVDPSIVNGTCNIIDRCNPNPCKHQAPCTQTGNKFMCNCTLTGYSGAVCHQSQNPSSCSEVALFFSTQTQTHVTMIDLDASGVLEPFNVTCDFSDKGVVRTLVDHDVENFIEVDGFDAPGSYRRKLNYQGASRDSLTELVRRAVRCEQAINYQCWNAHLFKLPTGGGTNYDNKAWGWWVGRKGQPRFYWGGSVPGLQKCACGVREQCSGNSDTCNCDGDGSATPPLTDSGLLSFKEDLPVMEIRLGDTGSPVDGKRSRYQVGQLRCDGDTLFDNTVTFRKSDANIELPPMFSENEFDITFLFRTTVMNAVFMQISGKASKHFLEIRIRDGQVVRFSFNVGNGMQIGELKTAKWLNDNTWHTVKIERNRLEYRVIVDDYPPEVFYEATDRAFQQFRFDTNLYIGTTQAYTDGYLGCLSNLIINGVVQDIRGLVERGDFTYGLTPGCFPKCASTPCMNRGECFEFYSHYYCECGLTSYRGFICGREVGVTMSNGPMIKINLLSDRDNLGTLEEYIQVGFKTKSKRGHLMQMSGRRGQEYIVVKVNNNGGITLEFDVGFQRFEVTTNYDIDLTNDQQHTVYAWRGNLGQTWHLKVDDYPEVVQDFSSILSESSDTRLDDPTFLYLGRNDTMTASEGFEGCIFRAQWNNLFALKMAFSDPPLSTVEVVPPENIREDRCGYEEIMPVPDPVEIRPYPTIPPNLNFTNPNLYRQQYEGAIAGGVVGFLFILLIIGVFCFCRYFTFDRGAYDTREAKGARYVDTADMAVKYGRTGQPEIRGKEWWL